MRKTALGITLVLVFLAATFLPTGDPASGTTAAENSWATKAPMPELEGAAGAAVVNGRIHVMGGSIHYEYDPATDEWVEKSAMPTPRHWFGIAAYQNKIYTIGGSSGWTQEKGTIYSGANEVYDPSTDTWETRESMPTTRAEIQANIVYGKIHLITNNTHDIYDIAADSWTTGKPMPFPYPVGVISSTVLHDKIYILGGDKTQIFDPESDSWRLGASSPVRVVNPGACATTGAMSLMRIYVFGGTVGFLNCTNATQAYDPETDTWALGSSMPTPRAGLTTAAVNDFIYAIGGGGRYWGVTESVNEQYTPFGYGTPDPSYAPPFAPLVHLPYITINSDGTVEPQTGIIEKAGSSYSLTSNLTGSYAIKIKCSNIIFDGKGHAINGSSSHSWAAQNDGLSLEDAANVTVKNLEISRFNPYDVSIKNCQSCTIQRVKANTLNMENSHQNTFSESALAGNDINVQTAIIMSRSSSNKIQRNNITGIILKDSDSNTFLENNIVFQHTHIFSGSAGNLWDNGTVGNWWSDYNGTDTEGDGIGDTPYIIDANNTDRYPLMKPVAIPELPDGSGEAEPFPTVAVLAVGIFAPVLVGAGLLFYRRKRRREAAHA